MKLHPLAIILGTLPILSGPICAVEEGHGSGASASGVAPASDEGRNAIRTFKFDAGLKCDLWAAEPLLANAVCFTQDEKGRWYVGETFRQEKGIEDNRGHAEWLDEDIAAKSVEDRLAYMHKHLPDAAKFAAKFEKYEERIRRLEDSTGSGIADKSVVFADGFHAAEDGTGAGLIARGGEVWYTCIPHLWHFADKNDDGVADVKEKLLSGFGIHFALRGHDMHGLRFGPDGKLYFSIGDRAINVKTKEGAQIPQTESGSIMRCNPDGTGFEIFTTGVRNPQELAFDEHGNLFTGDNNSDAGDAARFTYLVEGGDCGWRMAFQYLPDRGPWMRERPWDEKIAASVRYIVPCIANISNGPSGLTYNPGTGLSEKYFGKFFLSDFRGGANASVVHEITLEPKGAYFTAKHRDWVKGILTTDVEFGNDGALYVLDWVSSWGGVGKGRIYKFTDPSANTALQKETETLIRDGMAKRPEAELAKLLGHADMRVRQAAQFELAGRGVASAKAFATIAADTKAANPLARLHGIWGLGQLAAKNVNALSPLPALLGDADPEVRAQAAKVLGDFKMGAVGDRLVALLKDRENRVRFFAALSLGKIGNKAAFEPLCAMLAENDDKDPILRHGGVMGLVGCGTAQQIAAKANDKSVALRGDAVVALRRMQSPLVAAFLKDADESVVLEAARAIHDVPIEAAMPALAALTTNKALKNPHALSRAVNANYRLGKPENARALAAFAADTAVPEAARKDALDALSIWANPNGKDRLLNQWRPLAARGNGDAVAAIGAAVPALLKDSPGGIQEMVAKLVAKLSVPNAGEPLLQLVSNDKAGANARIEAVKALAAIKDARLSQAAKIAISANDPKLRSEGLQALAGADPATAVRTIGDVINTGSVIEKQGALLALAQMKGAEADAVLSGLLDKLIAKSLPAEIQLDVIDAAAKRDNGALKDKVARYENGLPAGDDLAKWRVALSGGNAERGRKIFREKAETQCLRCHKCEDGDSVVGPELTHIGAAKDRAYLLESIVLPNKQIAEGFETVVLTLTDGNVVAGTFGGEDAAGLKIKTLDAQGKLQTQTIPRAQIKDRQRAPSPMPPNLTDFLSKSELRDLVEYLATRK
jgi:quinoprotein glucose dehydrogenase